MLEKAVEAQKFLSTPSARRATSAVVFNFRLISYFYPRPPRGGRRYGQKPHRVGGGISIHALREEGDLLIQPSERR